MTAPRAARAPTTRAVRAGASRPWSEKVPGVWRWSRPVARAGAARSSRPRDFSICIRGRFRAAAGRARAPGAERELEAVALGPGVPRVSGVGGRRRRRVDVRAAGQHQAVEQVEQLVGFLGGASSGGSSSASPAGALRRARVGARGACHIRPRAPAGASIAVQMPMTGRPAISQALEARNFSQSVTAASKRVELDVRAGSGSGRPPPGRRRRARSPSPANRSRAAYSVCGTRGLSES